MAEPNSASKHAHESHRILSPQIGYYLHREGTHSFHAKCKKIYNLLAQKMQPSQRRGKELSVSRRRKRLLPPCRMWRKTEIWLLSCSLSWRRAKVPWIQERPGTGDHHKVTTKKDLVVRGGHCGQSSVLLTRAACQVHAAVSKPGGLHPGQNFIFLGF